MLSSLLSCDWNTSEKFWWAQLFTLSPQEYLSHCCHNQQWAPSAYIQHMGESYKFTTILCCCFKLILGRFNNEWWSYIRTKSQTVLTAKILHKFTVLSMAWRWNCSWCIHLPDFRGGVIVPLPLNLLSIVHGRNTNEGHEGKLQSEWATHEMSKHLSSKITVRKITRLLSYFPPQC